MRILLALVVLFTTRAFAATAPDSIAGKVYRETTFFNRATHERTIVFGTDGRFTFLKDAVGSSLNLFLPRKIFLAAPRADGTYVYRRTSLASAEIDLAYDDSTKETILLNFTADNSSTGTEQSWVLTDLAASQFAPANNISMRGRVTPGRPLIVGFVVPGTNNDTGGFVPAGNSHQREILIRVVGPSLAPFGVADLWADPDFQLYRGNAPASVNEVHYADWSSPPVGTANGVALPSAPDAATAAAYRKIFNSLLVGAFPLIAGSKDAADLVRLSPGAYTIVCAAPDGDAGGEVLVEVYFLP